MDPIRDVLDEQFFLEASPECLHALAKLVDDALALRFQTYLEAPEANGAVTKMIEEYLGPAIKAATYHLRFLERGSEKLVDKIELETIADTRIAVRPIIQELEFINENIQYARAYIEPRKKSDYDAFLSLIPRGYKTKISANSTMFYQPRARARITGVGQIIKKRDIWTIALKGLKFRDYFASAGYALDSYQLKEF